MAIAGDLLAKTLMILMAMNKGCLYPYNLLA